MTDEYIVIDTNITLRHLENMHREYKDNLVIPYIVLGELDKAKNRNDELGYKARKATRYIIEKDIRVENFYNYHKSELEVDNKLIKISTISQTKVLTKDLLLYLKAKSKGDEHSVELFSEAKKEVYTGIKKDLTLTNKQKGKLYKNGYIKTKLDMHENQFAYLDDIIVRYKQGKLIKVGWNKGVQGFDKLNARQIMAHELLYDKDVRVIALWGKAGTGKTAMAIKSAITMANEELYSNVLLSRPTIQNGIKEEKLNTLPGNIEDKQAPFMQPFKDNMDSFQTLLVPEIQPLTTIQGRSIKDTLYIIDEAQNIKPRDIPSIVERMGKKSKLVLTGDPRQIIRNDLNYNNNGLSFLVNTLKGDKLFGCVNLTKVERGEIAKLGDKLREKL